MAYQHIVYDYVKKERIGSLTLNRPETRNALSLELLEELSSCLTRVAEKREAKVITIKGAGVAFCAGHDLKEFLGKEFLLQQKQDGIKRIVAGLVLQANRGAPRHGAPVSSSAGKQIGFVTSGSFSPSLNRGIGLVLILPEHATVDEQVLIDIRGTRTPASIVDLPFYSPSGK